MPALSTEECRVVLLSPLEIHFSQTRIRSEFQDGHTVEETQLEIKAVERGEPLPGTESEREGGAEASAATPDTAAAGEEGATASASSTELAGDRDNVGLRPLGEATEDLSSLDARAGQPDQPDQAEKDWMLLWHPFPRIEVTKWRCKLREPDGSPKLDPHTGLELYSHEERWFSFDNRRLYCLQKAAAAVWPRQVRCEVVEIPTNLARMRELRKFDTRTFGLSVIVGRRDDPSPEVWSWRKAVGIPEEDQPEDGVGKQRSMRWRGGRGGKGGGRGANSRNGNREEYQDSGPVGVELLRSGLLFFLVYLGLRLVVSIFRHRFQGSFGLSPSGSLSPGPSAPLESVSPSPIPDLNNPLGS
mmetsp:Transcript_65954/g.121694  ORF Transcript_65954/g.121694 Transcript_65954/m.121694 type:complete len:358 (+) Transcript_65954:127-1200(+)